MCAGRIASGQQFANACRQVFKGEPTFVWAKSSGLFEEP